MGGYEELKIYQRSYDAARAVYENVKRYPQEEVYGLISQMKRASISIPLNIAEGYAKRESQKEFKRFLLMAMGSTNEMKVLMDFSRDLGYIGEETHRKAKQEYDEIGKMLNKFIGHMSKI